MQNSMGELFGIMNVLDPEKWDDEGDFLARFGKEMPTAEQVQDLQVSLFCYLPHLYWPMSCGWERKDDLFACFGKAMPAA